MGIYIVMADNPLSQAWQLDKLRNMYIQIENEIEKDD